MLTAVERSLRLVNRAVTKGCAYGLEVQARRGKLRGVDLDPDRGVLRAGAFGLVTVLRPRARTAPRKSRANLGADLRSRAEASRPT